MSKTCGNCAYSDACLMLYHSDYSKKDTIEESQKDFVFKKACQAFLEKEE